MWIIRFGKLRTKDYNTLARLFKKSGFLTRQISPIIYSKALILHVLQKRSLRSLSAEFSLSHIALHKFFTYIAKKPEYWKIFHVFLESRATVFLENTRQFTQHDLDNSEEIYSLTERTLQSMLK